MSEPQFTFLLECPTGGHDASYETANGDAPCVSCDRNTVARCKPGHLDRLRVAANAPDADSYIVELFSTTTAAIFHETHRLCIELPTATGLARLQLISDAAALITVVPHYPYLEEALTDALLTSGFTPADLMSV